MLYREQGRIYREANEVQASGPLLVAGAPSQALGGGGTLQRVHMVIRFCKICKEKDTWTKIV
jgi:hypothetical protein